MCSSKWCDPEIFTGWARFHSSARFSCARRGVRPHALPCRTSPGTAFPSRFPALKEGLPAFIWNVSYSVFHWWQQLGKVFSLKHVKLSQTSLGHSKGTNWLFLKNQNLTICFVPRSGITYSKAALSSDHCVCIRCAGAWVYVCMTVREWGCM